MLNFKLLITQLLLCLSSVMFAQEICDNGIDDDNDGFIDLNDDECACSNTISLTETSGSICRDNLSLVLEDPDAISYQWYKDGIAVIGETNSEILLEESGTVEGNYQVMVIKADGCYLSEAYEVEIRVQQVHLGEEVICLGDTIFFGGFALTFSGFFQNNDFGVDGCDSITTLNVVIQQPAFSNVNGEICDGQMFEYHDLITDVPGTYEFSIPTAFGCDSLVTLNLTEGELETKEIDANICTGETYQEYGISADAPGSYEAILENPMGCDTVLTVNLSIIDQPTLSITDSFCPGDIYNQYGIETDLPGIYDTVLSNPNGCDTILTLELTEKTQPTLLLVESICIGEVYDEYGIDATDSGSYVATVASSTGCDTLLTVDLTVEEAPTGYFQKYICTGDTFIFQDIEESESGTYTTSYDYGGVCDSTVTFELIVTETIVLDLDRTICEGEVFDQFGITEDTPGTYENIINNTNGCDSIITLNLSVAGPTESFLTEVICPESYFDLYDIYENTAGTYQTIIENVNGCDSTINVDLSILPEANEEVFYSICEGDQLEIDGATYTEEDIYYNNYISSNGCDSTVAIHLTVEQLPTAFREVYICSGETFEYGPISEYKEGIYDFVIENADACDSLVTIQLLVIEPGEGIELAYYHTVNYGNTIDIAPEFMGEGVTDITWMNGEGIEIGVGPVLEDFMTLTDIDIQLNGIDGNGCPVEARARIDVSIEIDIFIPNIFTPDGDGDNDFFQLYGGPTVSGIKELYIYDTWGALMYSAHDVPANDDYIGWDGTLRGKPVVQGVYPYIAIFKIVTGVEKTVTGTITVIH